jgi:hypothetical protein
VLDLVALGSEGLVSWPAILAAGLGVSFTHCVIPAIHLSALPLPDGDRESPARPTGQACPWVYPGRGQQILDIANASSSLWLVAHFPMDGSSLLQGKISTDTLPKGLGFVHSVLSSTAMV